ncbi:hypothetical protein CUJ83_11770 [Methanocella sp. CWC-04]|uniref:HFX-2341-like N-terminal domain-containing protein n=1 Tax=Methanooceanicella nereidis TaxID=2052831 RepID=A0AAP2RGE8_9EURY|nr:DUF6293 family protein [Methanocella sp. CWC-04]MCD1295675.1 hypothetical protein [Methanocella sp. CWC-04]
MTMKPGVHIVPTGFEYDRVIQPLINDFTVKKAYLLVHDTKKRTEDHDKQTQIVNGYIRKIKDIPFKWEIISTNIYNFDDVFKRSYDIIKKEVGEGNPVYINISSASKVVQLALTMAAFLNNKPGTEEPAVQLFYVEPERYYEGELIGTVFELLKKDEDEQNTIKKLKDIAREIRDHGMASGKKDTYKFPPFPLAQFTDIEYDMLKIINEKKVISSIKEMKELLDMSTGRVTPRSNIKYYLDNMEKQGLITTEREKKELKISLTRAGELFAYAGGN